METHHPHHVTHKKKWAEYLLEFFMLFLAVFLGFVAENVRENITEPVSLYKLPAKAFAIEVIINKRFLNRISLFLVSYLGI